MRIMFLDQTEITKTDEISKLVNSQVSDTIADLFVEDSGGTREEFLQNGLNQNILKKYTDEFNTSYQASLKRDHDQKTVIQDLTDIFCHGSFRGDLIPTRVPGRFEGPPDILKYRSVLMKLYTVNPDLVSTILKENIIGGHGSNSSSLISTMEHGLRPPDDLLETGSFIFSGEGLANYKESAPSGLNDQIVFFTQPADWSALMMYANKYQSQVSEQQIEQSIENLSKTIPSSLSFSKEQLNQGGENYTFQRTLHQIEHLKRVLTFLKKPNKTELEQKQEEYMEKSFPVIYLIGGKLNEGGNKGEYLTPHTGNRSIVSEYIVNGGTSPEMTKIVLLPQAEIEGVAKLIQSKNINWHLEPIEPYQVLFRT